MKRRISDKERIRKRRLQWYIARMVRITLTAWRREGLTRAEMNRRITAANAALDRAERKREKKGRGR